MSLKSLKEELLQGPKFAKEYYDSDDWGFKISLIVKRRRIEKGLTQKELAERIGTKQPSIARLENGNNNSPSFSFLQKLAKALDKQLIPPKLVPFEETKNIGNSSLELSVDVSLDYKIYNKKNHFNQIKNKNYATHLVSFV